MQRRRHHRLWICALVAPLAIVLGIPAIIASWSGELYRMDAVIESQRGKEQSLFGSAYSSQDVPLKMGRILRDGPELLVIGSSRTLDMRSEFFRPEFSFYNGGRLASDVWVMRQALQKLPADRLPKHLLIGLDQYNFNAGSSKYHPDDITEQVVKEKFAPAEQGWERFGDVWPSVAKDLIKGKIHAPTDHGYRSVGLAAKMQASGFRNDGSYRYGGIIDHPPAERSASKRMEDAFDRIEDSEESFEHGDHLNLHALEEVGRLLDWCKERGIKVTAYFPPFAPSVIGAMRNPPHHYQYLDTLYPQVSRIFTEKGLRLFDFTQVPGSTDEQFIDGFHPSERIAGTILLKMAEEDPVAGEIIDAERLRMLLSQSQDPLVLVP